MQYLPMLSDAELLRHADSELNDLTSTDLERELLKRLAARVEREADPLMVVLNDHDIEDADELTRYLKRAALLVELLDGNADLFKRLADASAAL